MNTPNGIVILHRDDGRRIGDSSPVTVVKAGQGDGAAGLTFLEQNIAPGGGPPPHIHHDADEAWYVLKGDLTYFSGEWSAPVTSGAFILVPRGTVHHYRVTSATPARILELFTKAGMEQFFEEVHALRTAYGSGRPPLDLEEPVWQKHGMTLLPQPRGD